jgi:PTS system cellobiose-specific IIC component
MEQLTAVIEKRVAPVANGLAKNRYIKAIQNTFMTLIPFFTIGSFALIIIEPPVDYTTLDAGFLRSFFEGWAGLASLLGGPLGAINTFTMGIMALWVAIGIPYFLCKQYKIDSLLPTFLATSCWLITSGINADGEFVTDHFDSTGLFSAILVTILAVEFFRFLSNRRVGAIDISGSSVPPAISDSFANLVPCAIVLLAAGVLSQIVIALSGVTLPEVMNVIMSPVVSLADTPGGVVILGIIVMLFWWFGIHDSVITSPLDVILYANLDANMKAHLAGVASTQLPCILTPPFWWTFMAIGGSGATFALAVLCLTSKSKQIKTVGKLGIVPAFFNINEPIIFGLPLMYNATMFIPFLLVMPLNGLLTYIAMATGLIGRTYAYAGWNMFAPIGALLSNMEVGTMLFCIALIVLDGLLYFPFFKVYEKQKLEEEASDAEASAEKAE